MEPLQNQTSTFNPSPQQGLLIQKFLQNGLLVLGCVGLVGGMFGALLSEVIQNDGAGYRFFNGSIYMSTGVWFALALVGIGAALSISQGLIEKNAEKSALAALLAVPASLFGGFLAGVIAQWVYGELVMTDLPNEIPRAIGWAIAGGLGGLAVGIGFNSVVRARNSLFGGLAGGFVGGLAFNFVGEIVGSDWASRFIGISLIGALMGLAVGLIDMLTVSSHVEQTMAEGLPMRFYLYDQVTILGCAGNVGISVRGDSGVAEHHVRLTKRGQSVFFECVGNATPVHLNGQPTVSGQLNHGDFFVVGNSQFRYSSKRDLSFGAPASQGQIVGQPLVSNSQANQPPQGFGPSGNTVAPSNSQQPNPPSRPVIPMKKLD
jgi:hypothetical protein